METSQELFLFAESVGKGELKQLSKWGLELVA
jgi:hypothetical protein